MIFLVVFHQSHANSTLMSALNTQLSNAFQILQEIVSNLRGLRPELESLPFSFLCKRLRYYAFSGAPSLSQEDM